MKHFFRLALCSFIILFIQYPALGAETPKIGVVDIQKFQKNSRVFHQTRGALKEKFDAMQKKLDEEHEIDLIGIVTTLEGDPLPSGDIASRLGGFDDIAKMEKDGKSEMDIVEIFWTDYNENI